MAHVLKLFGISLLVICSSCESVSSSDNIEDEGPKILYESNENYFFIQAVRDAKLANSLWVNMDSVEKTHFDREFKPPYDKELVPKLRYLKSVKLSFPFPFYGYLTDYITLDVDGRICIKKILDYNEKCNSFVAPLATKLSFHKDESYLKYIDTGESFVVQWGNVDFYPPFYYVKQNVSMQVTLHNNGLIEFVYKQILSSLFVLLKDDRIKKVTIGTSDSIDYNGNENFPYGVIALHDHINKDFDIKNGTVIKMSPLPTCNWFTNCESCAQTRTHLMCQWCPQLHRCSNFGIDRGVKEWLSSGCDINPISNAYFCYD
ncbi:Hypothetical predicted protein [Cloeon dipterum]|uniref:PSI domain-containing protein n=1 Tax=Cloeon dipterum TaxID=197152 RepID=A0A8S1CSN0_9INSE|nr:Hypothetical predicted protein [Cloeon dipterum]